MSVPYEIILAAALAIVILLALMLARQRAMATKIGTFVAQVRTGGNEQFIPGTVQYAGPQIEFFRTFSLAPRPTYVWPRDQLEVISRERAADLAGQEQYLVRCRFVGQPLDFLMTPAAYAGLTSWLEAAPPSPPTGIW